MEKQIVLESNAEYEAFVDKFKPKLTTDDCYTPPEVYEVVKNWACAKYGIDPAKIVRPFYPGGDYESFDYNAPRWRRLRASVLRRDGYLCRYCLRYGRRRQATTVHHIEHADEHPELAYNADNLVSLCEACHNKMHPEKAKNAGRYGI